MKPLYQVLAEVTAKLDSKPMLLWRKLFILFYSKSLEGGSVKEDNKFRASESPDCSYELFYERIHHESITPPEDIIPIKNNYTGILEPEDGKALSGTLLHEGIEKLFGDSVVSELPIETEVKGIIITGHVDMVYKESGQIKVCDIKTLSTHIFDDISGKKILKPNSYSDLKYKKAISQANIYTILLGLKHFSILWIDKDSLAYKLENFLIDEVEFAEIVEKLVDVSKAIKRFREGDKSARPRPSGTRICNYCDAHMKWCLGKDSLPLVEKPKEPVNPTEKKVKRGFLN